MTWHEAHRYNAALREIQAELDSSPDADFDWQPEYAEIFGSRDRLLLALRSRWETMLHAQADDPVALAGRPSDAAEAVAAAHQGLFRLLTRLGAVEWVDLGVLVAGAA